MIERTPATATYPLTQLRCEHELTSQLTALHHWAGTGPTAEFYRGATDALTWLITGGPGPLTGRGYTRPVTTLAITTELAHADDLTATGQTRRRHYVIGIEHALQWAEHDTTVAPLSGATRDDDVALFWRR